MVTTKPVFRWSMTNEERAWQFLQVLFMVKLFFILIGVTQLTGATRDLSGFANLTGLVQLRNS
ncbi:MAG: hypothetical protein DYG89_20390 [Caldilinea sp. CFX5]|nr:hypothetical protein [Caldilinea sp. CFX5]